MASLPEDWASPLRRFLSMPLSIILLFSFKAHFLQFLHLKLTHHRGQVANCDIHSMLVLVGLWHVCSCIVIVVVVVVVVLPTILKQAKKKGESNFSPMTILISSPGLHMGKLQLLLLPLVDTVFLYNDWYCSLDGDTGTHLFWDGGGLRRNRATSFFGSLFSFLGGPLCYAR